MRTIDNIEGLKASVPSNLPANVPSAQAGQVWTALAELGRQLQILAGAQTAQGNFSAQNFPPSAYAPVRLSVVELVNLFLLTKAKAGKSDRYIRTMRYNLKKFIEGRAGKFADELTTAEIEDWMNDLNLAPRSLRGHLGDVRTMFNFAIRRGLLRYNPASGVELPSEELPPVLIHTPETARAVLNFARNYDPDICRALAVRYFAGVRTIEAERMTDGLIGEKYIEITVDVVKRGRARRRRLITIQPNLRAWLALGGSLPSPGQNGRRMLEFM